MDFSSVERALKSLSRRQPSLSPSIVETSDFLLTRLVDSPNNGNDDHDNNDNNEKDQDQIAKGLLQLLRQSPEHEHEHEHDSHTKDKDKPRWEPLAVGLYVTTELLVSFVDQQNHHEQTPQVYVDGPRVPSTTTTTGGGTVTGTTTSTTTSTTNTVMLSQSKLIELCEPLQKTCQTNLEHAEPRIRTLVAKAVGAHVRFAILNANHEQLQHQRQSILKTIMTSLYQHLQTGRQEAEEEENHKNNKNKNGETNETKEKENESTEEEETENQNQNQNNKKYSKSSTGALDDTTGWRALETNWQGLASYIVAASQIYLHENSLYDNNNNSPNNSQSQLMEAIQYCSIEHVNRHVRAAAIAVLEQLLLVASKEDPSSSSFPFAHILTDPQSVLRTTTVNVLKVTLADNWSQVRMAASVLCRTFWTCLFRVSPPSSSSQELHKPIYRVLLPRMCLNRFYLAQGVKLYSHETWKVCFPSQGLELVANNAGAICRYYIQMCDADNHVVREAACQAVAELATKIGTHPQHSSSLAPFVPMLLQALLMCFHDESWPVRDEACLACGIFCRAYPEECRPELKVLYERWTEQLTDQIWSVREDAAVALGDALMAYPELLPDLLQLLQDKIPAARDQPPQTMEDYKAKQNDIESHTDSQLYSCGSLAPKLGKGSQRKVGAGRIGCMSCGITRPKAPWEATDGCIYLVRELCIKSCPSEGEDQPPPFQMTDDTLVPLLEQIIDVCRVRHFPQADDLRTTLWRNIPLMAQALGKQRFKRNYLQLVLEPIFLNLESRTASALSQHAAGQCVEELALLVGPLILKGRLMGNMDHEELFDQVMQERQQLKQQQQQFGSGGGNSSDGGFSPFGPADLLLGVNSSPSNGSNGSNGSGSASALPFPPTSTFPRTSPHGGNPPTTTFPPTSQTPGLGLGVSESL